MERIQINHSVVNENIVNEVKKYMIAPWQRYSLIIASVVSFVVGVINLFDHHYMEGTILIVLVLGCIFETEIIKYQKYKEALKNIKEKGKNNEMIYSLIFNSDYISLRNVNTGESHKVSYTDVKGLKETASTFVIRAKKSELIVVNKEALKISKDEFIAFIQSQIKK